MTEDEIVGGCDIEFLNSRAREIVEEKTANSRIFDLDAEAAMPRFEKIGENIYYYCFFKVG